MDFASPPCVTAALRQRLEHPVLGYATAMQSTLDATVAYLKRQHDWTVDPAWVVFTPGVVPALHGVVRAMCGTAGDAVVTTTPIYPPFLSTPKLSGKALRSAPMKLENGRWTFDFDALERALTDVRPRVFLLCNPYNPLGRVFDRGELAAVAAFAQKHDITVCSDEIHCDLVLDPAATHTTYGTLGAAGAGRAVSLFAASKTYNTAGLLCGYAVIPDAGIRAAFRRAMAGIANEVTLFGFTALEAAYTGGEPWRQELLAYLRGNLELALSELAGLPNLPVAAHPQATYLAWLDARQLATTDPVKTFEDGGVLLGNGTDFGAPGHVRLNFGCPRPQLRQILKRIRTVAEKYTRK
jgi:cystathionine beta-lyase